MLPVLRQQLKWLVFLADSSLDIYRQRSLEFIYSHLWE
jgi:hypothetical protein